MLLGLPLSDFGPAARCTVLTWHISPGAFAAAGTALLDLSVDMSGGIAWDCPPVTTCRVVLGEAAILRRALVATGEPIAPGALMALLSTDADTTLAGPPARAVRCTVAAILHQADWWAGSA